MYPSLMNLLSIVGPPESLSFTTMEELGAPN